MYMCCQNRLEMCSVNKYTCTTMVSIVDFVDCSFICFTSIKTHFHFVSILMPQSGFPYVCSKVNINEVLIWLLQFSCFFVTKPFEKFVPYLNALKYM